MTDKAPLLLVSQRLCPVETWSVNQEYMTVESGFFFSSFFFRNGGWEWEIESYVSQSACVTTVRLHIGPFTNPRHPLTTSRLIWYGFMMCSALAFVLSSSNGKNGWGLTWYVWPFFLICLYKTLPNWLRMWLWICVWLITPTLCLIWKCIQQEGALWTELDWTDKALLV